MTIRAILFDKDGTLLDFEATWGPAFRAVVYELAGGDEALARRLAHAGGFDLARGTAGGGSVLGAGSTREAAEAWSPLLGDRPVAELTAALDRLFEHHGTAHAHPVTELQGLFGRLRARGLSLGVATNDGARAAEATLARLSVRPQLDFVAGYDSGHGAKPAAGMVHAFAAATGVTPLEIAVVGDNVHDLAMGRAAGVGMTVGVLTGNATRDELARHADHVLDSIATLESVLEPAPA